MQKCDVFIALLPKSSDGKLARSDGTHVELGWASALGKPIILVVDSDVEGETSHLVKGLGAVAHVTRVDSQALRSDPGRVMKLANDVLRLAKEIQNA
jgi:nucleoside 2-deoxyribosyltransferase